MKKDSPMRYKNGDWGYFSTYIKIGLYFKRKLS